MAQTVSQREFAKHIGRSNVWVSKLVKSGKLPVDDKGKIPLEAGLAAYNANTDVSRDPQRENNEKVRQKSVKKPNKKPEQPGIQNLDDDDDSDSIILPSTTVGVNAARISEQYNKAKLAKETYLAKLKELEYNREKGNLLSRDQVEADAAAVAVELRNKFMGMGARIGPLCEGLTAREIEIVIEDEINDILKALQKSQFMSE